MNINEMKPKRCELLAKSETSLQAQSVESNRSIMTQQCSLFSVNFKEKPCWVSFTW